MCESGAKLIIPAFNCVDMSGDDQMAGASSVNDSASKQQPGADEMFCAECGAIVKKRAEVCPDCGVPQQEFKDDDGGGMAERRKFELEKMASKDATTMALVGFLISPLGYWMLGKTGLAIVNVLTFNYFLLGFLIVPFHCYSLVNDAKEELRRAGVEGY